VTRHIYALPEEGDALTTQASAMAGEGRKAVRVHDSMERHVWLVAVM